MEGVIIVVISVSSLVALLSRWNWSNSILPYVCIDDK